MKEIRHLSVTAHDGTALMAYDCGPTGAGPHGPTLVLANGLGGNIDAWAYFVDFFGEHHRIVSWDYRGLYRSAAAAGSDYTISTHADDGIAVLQALGVERAVFVGWSMGVQVSFEIVRRNAAFVQGLVLINGTYGRPLATAFAPLLKQSPIKPMIPAILRALEAVSHLAEPAQPYAQKAVRLALTLQFLKATGMVSSTLDQKMFVELAAQVAGLNMPRYMAILNSLGDHCAEAILPQIDKPTLIVSGDRDLFTPVDLAREMARRINDAELLVIPSGTHYTPLEFPELIHLRVQKFLRDRLGFDSTVAPQPQQS
jgi:pimeloyl-ACP methyl ester carboxylesterase